MGGGAESSAFPDAPATLDPSKPYADGDAVAMFEQREHVVRQKLVKVETAKAREKQLLLRERVQQCYRVEGVNHYQNCREHVHAYLESIKGLGMSKINWH